MLSGTIGLTLSCDRSANTLALISRGKRDEEAVRIQPIWVGGMLFVVGCEEGKHDDRLVAPPYTFAYSQDTDDTSIRGLGFIRKHETFTSLVHVYVDQGDYRSALRTNKMTSHHDFGGVLLVYIE